MKIEFTLKKHIFLPCCACLDKVWAPLDSVNLGLRLIVHELLVENEPFSTSSYHPLWTDSSGAFHILSCLFWPIVSCCEPAEFKQFSKITPNALTLHTRGHDDALWSRAFMFTEHNIPQCSSSPSHTAGECHGFRGENISFNKASTDWASQEMEDLHKHRVSCCSHSSCSGYNRPGCPKTHISSITLLFQHNNSGQFSNVWFSSVVFLLPWEIPSHCLRHKHPHTLPVGEYHTKCVSHINIVCKKNPSRHGITYCPVWHRKWSQGLMGIPLACVLSESKESLLSHRLLTLMTFQTWF